MRLSAAALALGVFTKWNAGRFPKAGRNRLPFVTNPVLLSSNLLTNVTSAYDLLAVDECDPLKLPVEEQCHHVKRFCARSETLVRMTYPQAYFCTAPGKRPFAFAGLLIWLVFLFSFISIAASNFFIPNLKTIAYTFGLDDNIAGVTFLAFGNGSPDLFSTLSAMRAGAGSLAIGELIGAASFIVSVVAGSMCIIKSFHVNPVPFLRDVGFFSLAMALLFWILWDSLITALEAALLAGLYVSYVIVVVVSTWWDKRRTRKQRCIEEARRAFVREPVPSIAIYLDDEPYRDNPAENPHVNDSLGVSDNARQRAHSLPGRIDNTNHGTAGLLSPTEPFNRPGLQHLPTTPYPPRHQRLSLPHRHHSHHRLQSFSLFTALEFRDIINSLHRESAAAALSPFNSPVSPSYAGGLYRTRLSRKSSRSSASHTWGDEVRLERPRSTSPDLQQPVQHPEDHHTGALTLAAPTSRRGRSYIESRHLHPVPSPIPEVLSRTQTLDSPSLQQVPFPQLLSPSIDSPNPPKPVVRRELHRMLELFGTIARVLFPTLADTRRKSASGMGASILAAPAVLMLTLTLPVVREEQGEEEATLQGSFAEGRGGEGEEDRARPQEDPAVAQSGVQEGQLIDLGPTHPYEYEQSHQRPYSQASLVSYASHSSDTQHEIEQLIDDVEEEVEEEVHGGTKFNKYLTAVQLILGPAFCVAVCFINITRYLPWLLFAAVVSGVSMSTLVLVFSPDGKHPVVRTALCLVGFVVAMVWIMSIADEVVQVLDTFGLIFGLSDAIIGLTIFAVGNSLADFVANLTVAHFAPIMGFSACFGGPMLNILLGIGLGGSIVIHRTGVPYAIEFDTTLFVSACGLLALLLSTLVIVPWNGFHLGRRWGIFLVFSYLCIMTTNILVEIYL